MNSNIVSREDYIKALSTVLTAKEDFERLSYYEFSSKQGNKSYLRLTLITGNALTFDVTDYTDSQIFNMFALMQVGKMPENVIEDTQELIKISKMINGRKGA